MIPIVDDFAPGRYVHKRTLELHGFEVREAATADEALKEVAARVPTLVRCDVNLPDRNAFWLCRELRSRVPDVPVVMISATYGDQATEQTALFSGAADFLAERLQPERLVERIKRHLPAK
jgi:two-component system C4-dicarboxylate transport response regulator DctD